MKSPKHLLKLGKEGVITGRRKGTDTTVEIGGRWRTPTGGYISPYFVTNSEKWEAELQNPYILIVYDKKISAMKDIPYPGEVAQSGRPLLIISETSRGSTGNPGGQQTTQVPLSGCSR